MNWIRRLLSRRHLEQELDAEVRFHFEQFVADAMLAGMSEAEARRAARLEFGGAEQIKEECRDARGTEWLANSLEDLRVASRGMRKNPGFAAAAIGVLALGIGGNAAIFSVVNAAFFRPLPYPGAERLVYVRERTSAAFGESTVPAAEFAAWERAGVFDALIGYQLANPVDLTAPGHALERAEGVRVTPNFFSTLGIAPQRGRDFQADQSETGKSNVVILSDSLWRRAFGASPAAIGAEVVVDGVRSRIAGVLPPEFALPGWESHGWEPPDVFLPVSMPLAAMASHKSGPFLYTIGRLRSGMDVKRAQARLQAATRELDAALAGWRFHPAGSSWVAAEPLQAHLVTPSLAALTLMTGAAICMLLIACANVANLFLARALAREKDVAARAALGASRVRLLRLLLSESLLLCAAGAALGTTLACLAAPGVRFLLPAAIPAATPLDWRALVFTAACTLGAAFVVGLAPAITAFRINLSSSMKDGGLPANAHGARGLLRVSLATAQLALSLALLTSAGLLLRSFDKLVRVDIGFDPQNLAAAELALRPYNQYGMGTRLDLFHRALADVRRLPDVETAALANQSPMSHFGGVMGAVITENMQRGVAGYYSVVSADYFRALRIPVLAGRTFQDGDKLGSQPVVILSQFVAHSLFGSADPLGQRVTGYMYLPGAHARALFTVIGVVGNVRHHGYQDVPAAEVYQPFEQAPGAQMTVIARSRIDSADIAPALRGAVQAVDPTGKLPPVERTNEMLRETVLERRRRSLLLGAFAALSLLVAMVGVYGVVAYSVARRAREIGVRMTLGARPVDVLYVVLRDGVKLAVAGCVIGLGLALWLNRALSGFLFGVGPWDAVTFLIASATLGIAVCLASYLPARKATRIDPAATLRHS